MELVARTNSEIAFRDSYPIYIGGCQIKRTKKVDKALLNEDIVASNVRLVGAGGEQRGIVSRSEALAEARSSGLVSCGRSGASSFKGWIMGSTFLS